MRLGTAGWSIAKEASASFPADGTHLRRYAQVLDCVEINSSFYRSHRVEVYERWAAQTPAGFRFSVKLPKAISHEARLRRAREPLRRFLSEVAGLGKQLSVIVVQLPPSFAFEPRPVLNFFGLLAEQFAGGMVCEPRHPSWFDARVDGLLAAARVSRVAADPAPWPKAMHPGGWLGPQGDGVGAVLYHRWHGSPRTYWSRYEQQWLVDRTHKLRQWPAGSDCWCVFDNTAGGAAVPNALELRALLQAPGPGLLTPQAITSAG